jgi:hypothetical protein
MTLVNAQREYHWSMIFSENQFPPFGIMLWTFSAPDT